MGFIEFEVEGLRDLRLVRLALTQQDRDIPREMDAVMIDEARLLRDIARRKVRSLPTPQKAGHTGMRREIAAGVHVSRRSISGGDVSALRIGTRMAERDEAMLPRGNDNPAKGWRHPVFGDRNNWVRQHSAFSWFMETMDDANDLQVRLSWTLQDAAEDIDKVV